MKNILFLIMCLLVSVATAQTGRLVQAPVVRQTTGDSIYTYSSLESAIAAAKDTGDVIYLPGGVFRMPTLNKKLSIYGTGYRSDSSAAMGATYILDNIAINNVTNNGIYIYDVYFFEGTTLSVYSNATIFFERCKMAAFNLYSANSAIYFADCIINSIYHYVSSSNSTFYINNCIIEKDIYSGIGGFASNVVIINSILLGNSQYSTYSVTNFTLISIENSIIITNGTASPNLLAGFTVATMRNCLVVCDTNRLSNLQFGPNRGNTRKDQNFLSSIFKNFPDGSKFTESSDYNTKSTCSDCFNKGIYANGGLFRSVPPVHIREKFFIVDRDGNITINFKVRAH